MVSINTLVNSLMHFLPLFFTFIAVSALLWVAHLLLIKRHAELGNEKLFSRQLVMLGLTLAGVLVVILALPVSESSRNQIIALVGLLISGIFAFSSSTIFANLLAGIMLRITKPFRTGDFVQVGDYFGRVVERGLLDTEIQTEVRDLVSLPNTFMITHPISVTRSSGTIISTSLSLGYDVHHATIDALLSEAALKCGLTDPFIHIVELGDFSVVYKVSGKLDEVKSLISSKTVLNRHVLDVLHDNQIEIMSPSYMNQRKVSDEQKVIPSKQHVQNSKPEVAAEEVMFDKAEEAQQTESQKQQLTEKLSQLESQLSEANSEQKEQLKQQVEQLKAQIQRLKQTTQEEKE